MPSWIGLTCLAVNTSLHKLLIPVVTAVFAATIFNGCIEKSTVVKVKKDGSGLIHHREYANTKAAMGAMGGLGAEGETTVVEDKSIPTEEELKAKVKEMGEGVALKTFRQGKNEKDWEGYEAIYTFEDINKIKLDMNSMNSSKMKMQMQGADVGGQEEKPAEEEEPEYVSFEMKDGVLKIFSPDPEKKDKKAVADTKTAQDSPGDGASDPFSGNTPGGVEGMAADMAEGMAAGMMAMMGPMMTGARVGFFVEIDGDIAETNAHHQNGKMLTVMKMDLGKVFSNSESMAKMDKSEGLSREEAQKIFDSVEGVDVDMQKPIVVKFK